MKSFGEGLNATDVHLYVKVLQYSLKAYLNIHFAKSDSSVTICVKQASQ